MKKTEFTLVSQIDGLSLSCLIAEPEDEEPRAVVMLIHGIMEHKGRYSSFMEFLTDNGFACAICDQRGYGLSVKSADDNGFTYGAGADGVLKDMKQFEDEIIRRYPDKKLFVFGHSMGALIAMAYTKRWSKNLNGVILSGLPADNPAAGAGKAYLKMKKTFKGAHYRDESVNKLMFKSYCTPFKGETSPYCWMNSDPDKVKEYEDDPLCGQLGTLDGYLSLLDLMTEAYDKKGWDKVSGMLPVLICVGADDPCAEGEKGAAEGEKFLKSMGLVRTEHVSYEGMRHEIHNEPKAYLPLHDMLVKLIAWM